MQRLSFIIWVCFKSVVFHWDGLGNRAQLVVLCCVVLSRSVVSNSVTPWTAACQAPLSRGILQARILEWVAMPVSRGSSQPGIKPRFPASQVDSLLSEPPGSPRKLEWVAYPFSGGSSWPRNWTGVSWIAGGFFTSWVPRESPWLELNLGENKARRAFLSTLSVPFITGSSN